MDKARVAVVIAIVITWSVLSEMAGIPKWFGISMSFFLGWTGALWADED